MERDRYKMKIKKDNLEVFKAIRWNKQLTVEIALALAYERLEEVDKEYYENLNEMIRLSGGAN